MKILMVCLGNICRSPLAEGIMRSKIELEGLDWIVDSAGTGAYHTGNRPDIRSIETANAHKIDISSQKARQVRSIDFDEFELIFAMDTSNYQDLRRISREEDHSKIKLILNESNSGKNMSVPDPYYGGQDGFEEVYQMLDIACHHIIENYSKK